MSAEMPPNWTPPRRTRRVLTAVVEFLTYALLSIALLALSATAMWALLAAIAKVRSYL